MTGVELIAAERQRQIEVEGWTPEHDDRHDGQEIATAAAAYLLEGVARQGHWANHPHHEAGNPPRLWPWHSGWWKPSPDPIRNLEKAGALIAAEIDRLQRKSDRSQKPG
jgi:hypothetical protein